MRNAARLARLERRRPAGFVAAFQKLGGGDAFQCRAFDGPESAEEYHWTRAELHREADRRGMTLLVAVYEGQEI